MGQSNTRESVYSINKFLQIPTKVTEVLGGCKHLQLYQVYPQQRWVWK